MKKPNLKFKVMFHVPDWGSEIIEGWACPMPHVKSLGHYPDDFLFYPMDGTETRILYKNQIFDNYDHAVNRLERENKERLEYHRKQIQRSTEVLRAAGKI